MADNDGEGVGESCWPPGASSHGGGDRVQLFGVRREIYDPSARRRCPTPSSARSRTTTSASRPGCNYYIDLDVNEAEDVLLHRRILAECADPDNHPVFHA